MTSWRREKKRRIRYDDEPVHSQLHSVDVATRTLAWESVHRMAAKTQLTIFFAGSHTTGAYIVVALQENHTPLVYNLVGQ